jgi:hypothetical protein
MSKDVDNGFYKKLANYHTPTKKSTEKKMTCFDNLEGVRFRILRDRVNAIYTINREEGKETYRLWWKENLLGVRDYSGEYIEKRFQEGSWAITNE